MIRVLGCVSRQFSMKSALRLPAPSAPPKKPSECFRQPPDLALIDTGLSGAIDGISLAAEIAALGVPVIFLTGDYQRACIEGREHAAAILIKPISVPVFLNSVASVLRTKVE